jgi:hypothetical protein
MRFKQQLSSIPAALLMALAAPGVLAQATPICDAADPVFLAEGPISNVSLDGAGGGAITAMGVTFQVPAAAPVSTPTAALTLDQFADPTPFPGRSQGGFLGATVIANGCVKINAGVPTAVATDVFSDVAENVVLGVVTAPLTGATFGVDGTPTTLLADARMPAGPIANAFGFEVTPESLAVGANVAVEGYYSNDGSGVLNVWAVEVDGGTLVNAADAQISIQRFRCANDVQVQGGIYLGAGAACTFAAPFSLALFDGAGNPIPFAPGDLDVVNGIAPSVEFCSYRLRTPVAQCPAEVRVELRNNGTPIAEATAP